MCWLHCGLMIGLLDFVYLGLPRFVKTCHNFLAQEKLSDISKNCVSLFCTKNKMV